MVLSCQGRNPRDSRGFGFRQSQVTSESSVSVVGRDRGSSKDVKEAVRAEGRNGQ